MSDAIGGFQRHGSEVVAEEVPAYDSLDGPSEASFSGLGLSNEEKARIVRETAAPGVRLGDIARRHGIPVRRLSEWRKQALCGELFTVERPFAAVEVEEAPGRGNAGTVGIEFDGVTVRLDGTSEATRIAEIVSVLRVLR